jgi:hypothetical protein
LRPIAEATSKNCGADVKNSEGYSCKTTLDVLGIYHHAEKGLLLEYLTSMECDIVYIQETHITDEILMKRYKKNRAEPDLTFRNTAGAAFGRICVVKYGRSRIYDLFSGLMA